jgi:hypothetical protein
MVTILGTEPYLVMKDQCIIHQAKNMALVSSSKVRLQEDERVPSIWEVWRAYSTKDPRVAFVRKLDSKQGPFQWDHAKNDT